MATLSRRRFLQASAATLAVPTVITSLRGAAPPSKRLTLGFIGVGTMGRSHLGSFLGYPDVQVVAVCDVVAERRDSAKRMVEDRYRRRAKGDWRGCRTYTDFREVLGRADIDAVVIATPDHWHHIPCVLACRAKKDIYCEKPLTLTIAQGRQIVNEAARNNVVFQTGSQQRSEFGGRFRQAAELVRNGRIGEVKTVRIGVGGPAVPCNLPGEADPAGTDWKFWLGPAPERPYNSILCPRGVHRGFPAWRNYIEYAGGGLADMGAHHFDIAQWALNMDGSGPVRVEPPAAPATTGLKFTYANGIVMYHGGPADCVFEGTEGTILVSRGNIQSRPGQLLTTPLGAGATRLYHSDNHRRNWLECVASRRAPICPPEVGHRSASICHLANIGYQLRRPLRWAPEREKFIDDAVADWMLDRPMSAPWRL